MARHTVKFSVPKRPLEHADIEFDVHADGEKFGELHISKGAVVWCPRDKSLGYRVSWEMLDRLLREHGTPRKP